MKKKLRSRSGETLTEVLVAALVMALAMILLVNMVTASQKLVTKSEKTFVNNMKLKNSVEYDGQDTGDTENTVELSGTDSTVTIKKGELASSDKSSFTWGGSENSVSDINVTKQSYTDSTGKTTITGYKDKE